MTMEDVIIEYAASIILHVPTRHCVDFHPLPMHMLEK